MWTQRLATKRKTASVSVCVLFAFTAKVGHKHLLRPTFVDQDLFEIDQDVGQFLKVT